LTKPRRITRAKLHTDSLRYLLIARTALTLPYGTRYAGQLGVFFMQL
jgi:hypothetical protein